MYIPLYVVILILMKLPYLCLMRPFAFLQDDPRSLRRRASYNTDPSVLCTLSRQPLLQSATEPLVKAEIFNPEPHEVKRDEDLETKFKLHLVRFIRETL